MTRIGAGRQRVALSVSKLLIYNDGGRIENPRAYGGLPLRYIGGHRKERRLSIRCVVNWVIA